MSDALDGIPREIAISWGMVADPQRGPKRELSHERIVEAAVAIADAEGLGAVTMSKVASSLGFTTMALYRYVTNKDELLLLMQEGVLSLPLPDRTLSDGRGEPESLGWREELREFAGILRSVYRDHPWLTDVPMSVVQLLTPNNVAVVDQALRAMRELTIAPLDKIAVLLAITTYVRANAELGRDLSRHGADLPASAGAFLAEVITPDRYPFLHPLVESGLYLGEPDDPEEEIEDYAFGLELILDGIAVYAEKNPADAVPDESTDQDQNPLDLDHVRRDPKVREAISRRKEAEGKLREARRREQELIKKALDRGPKTS